MDGHMDAMHGIQWMMDGWMDGMALSKQAKPKWKEGKVRKEDLIRPQMKEGKTKEGVTSKARSKEGNNASSFTSKFVIKLIK